MSSSNASRAAFVVFLTRLIGHRFRAALLPATRSLSQVLLSLPELPDILQYHVLGGMYTSGGAGYVTNGAYERNAASGRSTTPC